MNKKITVYKSRKAVISDRILAFENEKNIDSLELEVKQNLPCLNWYLEFDSMLIPFIDMKIRIDERLTKRKGVYTCRIIGSDAEEGQELEEGKHLYKSSDFEMEVIE